MREEALVAEGTRLSPVEFRARGCDELSVKGGLTLVSVALLGSGGDILTWPKPSTSVDLVRKRARKHSSRPDNKEQRGQPGERLELF